MRTSMRISMGNSWESRVSHRLMKCMLDSMVSEVVASLFKCMVKTLSSLIGSRVAGCDIIIAVCLRGDFFALQRRLDHLAFSSIDAGGDHYYVCWTIHDVFDLVLELGVQVVKLKTMLCEMVIEHLMFKNMIGIHARLMMDWL